MKEKISNISISRNSTLLESLKLMDKHAVRLLLVVDGSLFVSVVSIGDIQRAIIKNMPLSTPVEEIFRTKIEVAKEGDNILKIKENMLATRTECMPVIDLNRNLIDVIFWEDLFNYKYDIPASLDLPVVIMAGGIGSRLKPLTNVIPKPLLPIGDKTIIEEIMDRFLKVGCKKFYISVNYRADLICHFLNTLNNPLYDFEFFQEDKPLGTAGSMFLLKSKINTTFFVSNCDIIIEQDYTAFYQYHKENKNDITIISALKHYPIPYGTLETGNEGNLIQLIEKPELTFKINSGMYILEPQILNYLEDNKFLHITELIERLQKDGGKIGVFPVNQGSWKDIGEWDEYLKQLSLAK